MRQLKTQFDAKLEKAIGEYEDGKKIAGDIPAYLALGVGYSPVNAVRVNVGFHWFDDKHATSYNNRRRNWTVVPWSTTQVLRWMSTRRLP